MKALYVCSFDHANYWLSRLVLETRRQDGRNYPPNTLVNLFSGLQRFHVETLNRPDLNFISDTNVFFHGFRKTLDGKMKQLQREGHGHVKSADTITDDDEKNCGKRMLLTQIQLKDCLMQCFFTLLRPLVFEERVNTHN